MENKSLFWFSITDLIEKAIKSLLSYIIYYNQSATLWASNDNHKHIIFMSSKFYKNYLDNENVFIISIGIFVLTPLLQINTFADEEKFAWCAFLSIVVHKSIFYIFDYFEALFVHK